MYVNIRVFNILLLMQAQFFRMSDPSITVPRYDEYIRLLHHQTGYVLFGSAEGVGLSVPFDNNEPQLWKCRWGGGNDSGTYAFQNKFSGYWLSSGNSSLFTLASGYSAFRGNFFRLAGVNQGTNVFQMWKHSLTNFTDKDAGEYTEKEVGEFSLPSTADPVDNNTLFSFLPEDKGNRLPWDRIEFHLDTAQILASTPQNMSYQTIENNTDVDQSQFVEFAFTVENSSSFEHTHGFSIMAGTEGKVGIPFVAEGSIKLEATTTHEWTWGSTETRSNEVKGGFPVVAPPRSVVTATSIMTRSTLDVPFTIYTKSQSSGIEISTHGIYKGVDFWGLRSQINQHSQVPGIEDKTTVIDVKYTTKVVSVHHNPAKKPQ